MELLSQKFRVELTEGEFLSGVMERPKGEIRGTVVIMHGRKSNKERESQLDQVRICHENKLQTVRFDFRGHGESSGSPNWERYGVLDQKEDIEAVLHYLKENKLTEGKLVFIASSFSAEAALLCASDNTEVEVLVLVSPGLGKSSAGTEDNTHRSEWWDKNLKVTQLEFASYKKALSNINQEIIALHGDSDINVPIEQSEELGKLFGSNFHLHIIKNGGHKYSEPEEGMSQRQKLLDEILSTI